MDTYKISNKDNRNYKYEYIKDFKCRVYKVEGDRKNNFRMPTDAKTFGVTARYLVIQLRVIQSENCTITIQLGDDAGNHFNFAFSTLSCKRPSSSQMCALINLPLVKDKWLNICFDLQQIAADFWPSGNFQTLDSLEISPVCFIRDIYATNNPLTPDGNGLDLPKLYSLPSGIASMNVLVPDPSAKEANQPVKSKIPQRITPTSESRPTRSPKIGSTRTSTRRTPPSTSSSDQSLSINGIGSQRTSQKKVIPSLANHSKKPQSPPKIPPKEETPPPQKEDEEEDYSDDNAFGSVSPSDRSKLDIKSELPLGEEEELELVFIESLDCYYCPTNQQYYQLDAH
ncbi:hypothetical protein TVAG_135200 [Trichomonas vaginalis G3]|uniref:CFA20 domain-containing protein n=1 Tax=Trichomonas vaginalis (strain ATCC PRA-98 / G3) TaxID=412133 RepID=A2FCA4_TRIV3|nr:Cilia- and flagella-associated protein 20/CFAP20DC family [Trichomonas vaginalis G3]EAX97467.1 hypothetical protein TVAG_135200 [Trichomonas vaginalis G3]KAI5496571.1 Cilia- and flagella-associated protein 20/CFAP20DC family [Trichomonas vaginalis G3]|eukprot:XP_001310397.1 hypothetical protein [Trichomonas vaginalis G3]